MDLNFCDNTSETKKWEEIEIRRDVKHNYQVIINFNNATIFQVNDFIDNIEDRINPNDGDFITVRREVK